MIYAKELAPNLFNSYKDWYWNYRKETNKVPSMDERLEASYYFLEKKEGDKNAIQTKL